MEKIMFGYKSEIGYMDGTGYPIDTTDGEYTTLYATSTFYIENDIYGNAGQTGLKTASISPTGNTKTNIIVSEELYNQPVNVL